MRTVKDVTAGANLIALGLCLDAIATELVVRAAATDPGLLAAIEARRKDLVKQAVALADRNQLHFAQKMADESERIMGEIVAAAGPANPSNPSSFKPEILRLPTVDLSKS
jgi:hypothetical protein